MYYFFYFPIGTDVVLRRRSVVTPFLVLANIVIYILVDSILRSPGLIYALAWKPAAPALWNALTACFLHAGPLHLAGNMLYLLLLGPGVEDRLGRVRFLSLYLVSGVLAMVAQAAFVLCFAPAFASYPVVGASGAVAGILGALLIRLPHARVRVASATLLLLHGVHKVGVRYVAVPVAVLVWVLLQLAYGLFAPEGYTAYWSHLGGLVAGGSLAVAGGALRAGRYERCLARATRYAEDGGWFAASGEYESALRLARAPDPQVLGAYARVLVAAGRRGRAIRAYQRAVGGELRREPAAAVALYLELERLLPAAVLEGDDQLAIALELRREGEFEAAAQALVDYAEVNRGEPRAELVRLLAAEVLARELCDAESAATLYRDIDRRLLPPRWQQHLAARRAGRGRQTRSGLSAA
jgi:membrane associated rhomboid family serine protease